MSTHSVPAAPGPQIVRAFFHAAEREPSAITEGYPLWIVTYTPDLDAGEDAVLRRIIASLASAVTITPAEWQAMESDIDGLRTYHGVATPTAAQTAAATKAIIRVLRAILRD
jgi:hypothetical protein